MKILVKRKVARDEVDNKWKKNKWWKLGEAVKNELSDYDTSKAHDAFADVQMTLKLLEVMAGLEVVKNG